MISERIALQLIYLSFPRSLFSCIKKCGCKWSKLDQYVFISFLFLSASYVCIHHDQKTTSTRNFWLFSTLPEQLQCFQGQCLTKQCAYFLRIECPLRDFIVRNILVDTFPMKDTLRYISGYSSQGKCPMRNSSYKSTWTP